MRLKVRLAKPKAQTWKRFNSKLVRLKANPHYLGSLAKSQFQFQTGAIKSHKGVLHVPVGDGFQFQTGAIKRRKNMVDFMNDYTRFNSKLVRLKAGGGGSSSHDECAFQFQTGAIKRQQD